MLRHPLGQVGTDIILKSNVNPSNFMGAVFESLYGLGLLDQPKLYF